MAVNRVPVLKRCRSLDLDPVFLGYDKKSKRKSPRAGKKMSEYGLQLEKSRKQSLSTVYWRSLSVIIMRRRTE